MLSFLQRCKDFGAQIEMRFSFELMIETTREFILFSAGIMTNTILTRPDNDRPFLNFFLSALVVLKIGLFMLRLVLVELDV